MAFFVNKNTVFRQVFLTLYLDRFSKQAFIVTDSSVENFAPDEYVVPDPLRVYKHFERNLEKNSKFNSPLTALE